MQFKKHPYHGEPSRYEHGLWNVYNSSLDSQRNKIQIYKTKQIVNSNSLKRSSNPKEHMLVNLNTKNKYYISFLRQNFSLKGSIVLGRRKIFDRYDWHCWFHNLNIFKTHLLVLCEQSIWVQSAVSYF